MSWLVRVVVGGGGYVGVMAADRVVPQQSSTSHITVTLIDPEAPFIERIRLHPLGAGGRWNVGIEWKQVLHHHSAAQGLSRGQSRSADSSQRSSWPTTGLRSDHADAS